ncbi:MAG: methyltransferase [Polyangiales bacterium]
MERPWLPPVWLARRIERVRNALQLAQRRSTLPPVALLELAMGAWLSQALVAAAELGVADALAQGPRTVAQLARELEVDEDSLARLLRALSAHGVFVERAGSYAQNALSRHLRSDVPDSLRAYLLFLGHPKHRAQWSALAQRVRGGRSERPFFDALRADRELGAVFDEGMSSLSRLGSRATEVYDFARFTTIVDVGGGRGENLLGVLRGAPASRGVLFDLPEVIAHALAHERMQVEGGSFFERVPEGGDAYVLKHILHDWADEHALAILRNVRRAMPPHGTLVLLESVVPTGAEPHLAKLIDLEMMVIDGKERSEPEWRTLLQRAGFTLEQIIETAGPVCILEARLSDTSGA